MILWRPMSGADLPRVMAIADVLHPNYPERLEIFADKLAFDTDGCRIAQDADSAVVGYAFSHSWRVGLPPMLDCELGPLPPDCDCQHLHDIALLPAARGLGGPRDFLRHMLELARRRGYKHLTLVAIKGQDLYWQGKGFVPFSSTPALQQRLDSYGQGVTYMTKTIA